MQSYELISKDLKVARELYRAQLISFKFAMFRLKCGYLARKGLANS